MEIKYDRVPVDHMQDGVRKYIEEGVMPGHFLTALFSNDLMGAFNRADDANEEAMKKWVSFLFCIAPASCWGNRERVEDWSRDGGLKGRRRKKEEAND